MKALIKVGYGCNENCTFCHTQDVRYIDGSAAEVRAKIARAAELGHSMVVFSGGEATIRPELMQWAKEVAARGMDLGLVTNGLILAYPEVVDRLVEHRLRYVYMSLHAASARIHDGIVRRKSFDVACRALRNLSGRGLDLTINCVVTRQNVEHLEGLVDLVLPYPDVNLKFSMVEPKGGAWHLFDHLVPAVSDAAARVREALERGRERRSPEGPRFTHGGFPLCLMEGFEADYDDLRTHRFATMVEVGEPDFFPVDDLAKVQPSETCRGCALSGPCPGLYRVYYERRGASELRPGIVRLRSNAFDWVFESLVETRDGGAACPLLRDGVTPWDRGRHLFVRHAGRVARYRADTRDFSDAEIETIKHVTGQVYLDASRKVAPDDFARDLVKLTRSSMCRGCVHERRCTGMFEPVFEDVFGRDEARLAQILSSLEGDVLDVGCGDGRCARSLAAAIADSRVRYLGIDPDPQALDRLLATLPRAQVRRVSLGVIAAGPDRFDHVIVGRSWNHLPDPVGAATMLSNLVRPGGSVIVVDNVAFGLARMPAQTRRARASTAAFEHYRNDDAEAAHRVLGRAPLRLVERIDVGPHTSNQWMLRYVAEAPATIAEPA